MRCPQKTFKNSDLLLGSLKALHMCQHLLFSDFLIVVILMGIRWYFTVNLVCISLTIIDTENLFMSLLDPLQRNVYSNPLPNFNHVLFLHCLQEVSIYSKYNPLSDMNYKYFLPFCKLSSYTIDNVFIDKILKFS